MKTMGSKTAKTLIFLIGVSVIDLVASEFKRVCYYTNWAQYRPGDGKYMPEDIDPNLCTHVIYSFAKLSNNVLKAYEWNDESTPWSKGMYERTMDMKKKNPNLKVSIAVGGWNHENQVPLFSDMVTSDAKMNNFVKDSVQFLRKRGFDGLDLDWEYPSVRPPGKARASDKQRFTLLCKRLREAFEAEAISTGKPRLLLTAAVAAGESTVNTAYEIAEIAKSLDFINLMAYDLNGAWNKFTGHNSPLFPRADEKGDERKLNQDWAVGNWLAKGTPREKLILGLATYGRSFTLSSPSDTAMGAAAKGAGNAGTYTREKGFLSYYEICQKLSQGWTSVWHDEHKVPYAYSGDQWVGYDNVRSITLKSKYIVQERLGGGMIWALDLDDFNGKTCNEGNYPLINAMKQVLTGADNDASQQQTPAQQTPPPSPTPLPTKPTPVQSNTDGDSLNGNTETDLVASEFKRVCYYTNWAQYRPGDGKYMPEDIDPNLCTHVIYSFAKLSNNVLKAYEWNDESTPWSKGMYERTMDMKKKNPNLKVSIAVGGWNHENQVPLFSDMVTSDAKMNNFVKDSVQFLRKRGFDGLDLDWEYPSVRPPGKARASDKQRFTLLCKRLREAFEAEAISTGKARLLLTAAVAAGESTVNTAYEIAEIAKSLDFINLMAYDLNGAWNKVTGHNSPLFPRADEKGDERKLNQDWAVGNWLAKGTPREKLVLGLATYGRSFTLSSPSDTAMGAAAKGAGNAGTYTREKGFLSYYEICQKLSQGWTSVWHDEHKVPYAYSGDQWVGYDNVRSITLKSKYIVQERLGGGMIWALDLDDFNGKACNEGNYPLINAMKEVLTEADNDVSQQQTPAQQTRPPSPTQLPTTPTPIQPNMDDDSLNGNTDTDVTEFKRVCYYTNWAQYRPGIGKYVPEDIDADLCTHIIYSFAKLENNLLSTYEWNDESMYNKVMAMKKQNADLKVLIAVGGWNHESTVPRFSDMVSSTTTLDNFVIDSIQFLRKYGFDGLDLDWEYPSVRPPGKARESDKQMFTVLCKQLRDAFDAESRNTGKTRLLLTAAVAAGQSTVDTAYEVDKIAKYLDFINLMAYDLHGSWESFTGHNSPLEARSGETGGQRNLNQDWAVNYWLAKGAPKEKLILGLATYGRSFTLSSPSNTAMGAAAKGAGNAGTYTREKGFLSYYEVCEKLSQGWTSVWHDEHKVPYAYNGDQWVGYDNVKSFEIKSKYIVNKGLGGGMIWAIDLDDFRGQSCGEGKYPLINAMKTILTSASNNIPVPQVPTEKPQTQSPLTPKPTTTKQPLPPITPNLGNSNADETAPDYKLVCYCTFWAKYRPTIGKFVPENIDPKLCTHIMYAFGRISGNKIVPYEEGGQLVEDMKKVLGIKKINPKLKVLLSLGGGTHDRKEPRFSTMVATNDSIYDFASKSVDFLRDYGFDGLDLDWEYPAFKPWKRSDKQRFSVLCEILRNTFNEEAEKTNQDPLLLTAAVGVGKRKIDNGYEVDKIAKNLDFINLMTYAFHGTWDRMTGHHSPLYARQGESNFQQTLNQDWAVKYWNMTGAPKHKLVLGLATYGISFTLSDTTKFDIGAPIKGGGTSQYIKRGGISPYYEICANLKSNNSWNREWQDEHKVPYAFKSDQWVGYDDLRSIEIKSNYIVNEGLGGAMVWTIDFDDFNDVCGDGPFPLITKIKDVLSSPRDSIDLPDSLTQKSTQSPQKEATKAPLTTKKTTIKPTTKRLTTATPRPTEAPKTTTRPTAAPSPIATTKKQCKPNPISQCPRQWLKDNCDCTKRYKCVNNFPRRGQVKLYGPISCPGTTVFEEERQNCVWPWVVKSGPCAFK